MSYQFVIAQTNTANSKLTDTLQSAYPNHFSIGFQVNAMNYFGDLSPSTNFYSTDLALTRAGFGVYLSRTFGKYFSLRAGLLYGRLRGDDFEANDPNSSDFSTQMRYARNLHFRNDIFEFNLAGHFNLLPLNTTNIKNKLIKFTPYFLAGGGVFYHNPQGRMPADQGGNWIDLQPLRTEGQGLASRPSNYSNWQFNFIGGVGVKMSLGEKLELGIESGVRFLFFDYIDDVSNTYPDQTTLQSDLSRSMSNRSNEVLSATYGQARDLRNAGLELTGERRGNPFNNDAYIVTNINLAIKLLPKKKKDEPKEKTTNPVKKDPVKQDTLQKDTVQQVKQLPKDTAQSKPPINLDDPNLIMIVITSRPIEGENVLVFQPGSVAIDETVTNKLDKIAADLLQNPDKFIEIHSDDYGKDLNSISEWTGYYFDRHHAVQDYFEGLGINKERVLLIVPK
ncbi:MAG TPA: hypothetical protein DCM08_10835 [Microscillaceae bacterium]|nr:hypothetical protein [Microscillaceae bacterium]